MNQPPSGALRAAKPSDPRVFSPHQLNDMVDRALADNIKPLWIEGELADVQERGGHLYFSLRDTAASVRGVMFSSDARRVRHLFVDGQSVRLKVAVGLYVPRGTFQIRALIALPAGEGDRAAEVLRLRKKLQAEGLLDPQRKRALPRWPSAVGIVTSRSGAALHDILEVARTRMPTRLVLVHATVQGLDAPESIVEALRRASQEASIEVIILARGGGAQDDLSAFEDERVARAIAASRVPVVSGVGHEVDVTTADLVADVRAATPSHAAELTVPSRAVFLRALETERGRAERALRERLGTLGRAVSEAQRALLDPRHRIARSSAELAQLEARMERAIRKHLADEARRLETERARLFRNEPRARLLRTRARLEEERGRLVRATRAQLDRKRAVLEEVSATMGRRVSAVPQDKRALLGRLAARLNALSPLGVLGRGYAIALHEGTALLRAEDAKVGDALTIRLHEGTLEAEVRGHRS